MKKIAIITFEISKIGGIATHAWELYKILKKKNIDVEMIYIKQTHDHIQSTVPYCRAIPSNFKLGGTILSLSKQTLKQSLYYLEQFDTLFFTHACIHEEQANWLEVYKLKRNNLVCISDIFWTDMYPYFDKAIPYVNKFFASNAAVKRFLEKKKLKSELLVHPFDYPEYKEVIKEGVLLWPSHWRNSKGIDDLCEVIPDLKCQVKMFGGGRGYSDWKSTIKKMKNVEYLGNQSPDVIVEAYKKSKYSIDLSGRSADYVGLHNRTTVEPMFFHCVSICYKTLADPHSHIPQKAVWIVEKKTLAKRINFLIEHDDIWKEKVDEAYKWVRKWYDSKKVIKQVMQS